jgi:hypothetical protein
METQRARTIFKQHKTRAIGAGFVFLALAYK